MRPLLSMPPDPFAIPQEFREPPRPAASNTGMILGQLTEREVILLRLVALGNTNKEMADALAISHRTVDAHLSNIMAKLKLRNRTQVALFALRWGIAPLP